MLQARHLILFVGSSFSGNRDQISIYFRTAIVTAVLVSMRTVQLALSSALSGAPRSVKSIFITIF